MEDTEQEDANAERALCLLAISLGQLTEAGSVTVDLYCPAPDVRGYIERHGAPALSNPHRLIFSVPGTCVSFSVVRL